MTLDFSAAIVYITPMQKHIRTNARASRGACARAATVLVAVLMLAAGGCTSGPQQAGNDAGGGKTANGRPRIGLLLDTLKEERWQHDRDIFVARAKELGADVLEQVANSDDNLQIQQAENLLTQGVDVLVVIPHNGQAAAAIVESAKRQNVPVICYDRLITGADTDLYISFDNEKVGELQAKYLLERAPKGNYILIEGAPTDNNAKLYEEGQRKILKPAEDRGDIKIVFSQPSREWLAAEAQKNTENALTQNNNNVVAVVAANDGTAGGAIAALEEQKLAGKVLVSGQDAELAAVQRIVAGTQTMTVYKPIKPLATRAAEAAVGMAKGEKPQTNATIPNGKKDVPSILLDPIAVDKNNVVDTVIKDGYQKLEDVYKNVPRDQWPQAPK
jgi:D-xylose transport system substrate-binding protein